MRKLRCVIATCVLTCTGSLQATAQEAITITPAEYQNLLVELLKDNKYGAFFLNKQREATEAAALRRAQAPTPPTPAVEPTSPTK